MSKTRVAFGIGCLAAAGLLLALMFALPEDEVVFMVGDSNMPYIPAVILGVIGVALLATARTRAGEDDKSVEPGEKDGRKADLNKRLETMAWGCFLIMLGGFVLVPHTTVAEGVWSIGIGMIMLGLNLARYLYNIRMSGFTTFLGTLALLVGIAQLIGVHALEEASIFLILGAYLVLKPWFDRHKIFGKAERG